MPPPRQDDPAIEALRGFAAVMVMAAHYMRFVAEQPGAWGFATTGVDLFFVLSGFVFGPYFFGKPLAWLPHLVRRFFRLYPLYLCALVAYAVLKMPQPDAWQHFWSHAFMAHTLRSLDIAFFYNPAFWSLPAEVEFYLVLPLIALALRGRRFVFLFAAALAAHLALVAFALPGEGVTARAVATVHLPGLLIEFCLGAAAWWLARELPLWAQARIRLSLGLAVLVVAAMLYWRFLSGPAAPSGLAGIWVGGNIGLFAGTGYALVVSALAGRANAFTGWRLALCLLAGQLSYGVYLFHNATPQVLAKAGMVLQGWPGLLAALIFTFTLAFALHHLIEAPLRNVGRDLSRRVARPVPA